MAQGIKRGTSRLDVANVHEDINICQGIIRAKKQLLEQQDEVTAQLQGKVIEAQEHLAEHLEKVRNAPRIIQENEIRIREYKAKIIKHDVQPKIDKLNKVHEQLKALAASSGKTVEELLSTLAAAQQ